MAAFSRLFRTDEFKAPKERPSWVGFSLFIILAVSFAFMVFAARSDSGTMDELAHIPAGYSYVSKLDYRLNPEHPPLLKALSALPLLSLAPRFPTDDPAWTSAVNGQWDMGRKFLYESGNDADRIIFRARLVPIILTLLLALLIFLIARDLFGSKWALLPAALFALSPSVLAHGHYVTTDVAAAFGILFSTYAFLGYISEPSRKKLFWAGLAFGIAQVLKFSAVLLAPFFLALVFFWSVSSSCSLRLPGFWQSAKFFAKTFFSKLWRTLLVFLIGGVFVIYPVYFLFTFNYPVERQSADTEYILASFAGGPPKPGEACAPVRCFAEATIFLSGNPVARPFAEYALGVLMVTQRSAGGNTAYFLGRISNAGSKMYFPAVFGLKETLPTLALILTAFALAARSIWRKAKDRTQSLRVKISAYFTDNFAQFSFFLFAAFYWFMSVRSSLNIGFRHLIPSIPLIYLLLTSAWKKWFTESDSVAKKMLLGVLLLWFGLEAFFAAPYFLSYFNEIGGGIPGGYRYVTDSNYDWGQDFLRLRDWAKESSGGEKIAIDYFGAALPEYYLPDQAVGWYSAKGDPRRENIHWLAVSVNTLESAFAETYYFERKKEDSYDWLGTIRPPEKGMGGIPKPDFRVGTSIFVYRLP